MNRDKSMASIPHCDLIEKDVKIEENENFGEELMPFTFVAVPPVSVKDEELVDDQSALCNLDPLLNNGNEEYSFNSDVANIMNVKRGTGCGCASELKNKIRREIDVYNSDVKIGERTLVIKHEEIIPESGLVAFASEMKQSSDKLSGTIEDSIVMASDIKGGAQSDHHVTFDRNDNLVKTLSHSFKSMDDLQIRFESICDVSENVLEEKPFLNCQNFSYAAVNGKKVALLTKDQKSMKCGINQLAYRLEEVIQPSDGVEINHCSAVSNIVCSVWRTRMKHVQREKDMAIVCREDQSDTDIVSEMQCNINLASHIRDHKSALNFTHEDPFVESKKALLGHENRTHRNHVRIKCGVKVFKCANCKASFSREGHLVNHIRTHTGEKPFKCSYCEASFSQKHHIVNHTRTHTQVKPFKCSYCEASFSQKPHLVDHTRSHTQVKPFKCSYCEASFSRKPYLVNHTRTHTGEKPFQCVTCNASFSIRKSLVRHILTHTGSKPFKCVTCDASFCDKSNLARHIRTHSGEKPFNCSYCMASFSRKTDLERHTRIHTG